MWPHDPYGLWTRLTLSRCVSFPFSSLLNHSSHLSHESKECLRALLACASRIECALVGARSSGTCLGTDVCHSSQIAVWNCQITMFKQHLDGFQARHSHWIITTTHTHTHTTTHSLISFNQECRISTLIIQLSATEKSITSPIAKMPPPLLSPYAVRNLAAN